MKNKPLFYFILLLLLGLTNCQEKAQKLEECSKFEHEVYLEESTDSVLVREALEYHNILLQRFANTSIKALAHESYHVQFYSSHGFGRSLKFEQRMDGYYLSKKCVSRNDSAPKCEEYQIEINKEDWDKLEWIIYEFNFWTTENFRTNRDVLDGYVYYLAGNRPAAKKCNKKTYKLVGRGSPDYDKMEALCYYLERYEEQLANKYGNRVKKNG